MCVVCCVVSCLAWRFTLFLVSSTCRFPVGPLFVSRLVLLRDFPKIRRSVHCPSRASTGSSHCPSYRDSATPRPLVPSVAQLLTQLDTSVRWEDVPISSTGSSFNTHPFVLLLTLISPLSYGGRETVFEPFERSTSGGHLLVQTDAIWKRGGRKAATLTQTSAPRASKGTSALCLPHSYCTPLGTSRMLFNYFSCEGH